MVIIMVGLKDKINRDQISNTNDQFQANHFHSLMQLHLSQKLCASSLMKARAGCSSHNSSYAQS